MSSASYLPSGCLTQLAITDPAVLTRFTLSAFRFSFSTTSRTSWIVSAGTPVGSHVTNWFFNELFATIFFHSYDKYCGVNIISLTAQNKEGVCACARVHIDDLVQDCSIPSALAQCTIWNVHACAHFCYKMLQCRIRDWYIMGSVEQSIMYVIRALLCFGLVRYPGLGTSLIIHNHVPIFFRNTLWALAWPYLCSCVSEVNFKIKGKYTTLVRL